MRLGVVVLALCGVALPAFARPRAFIQSCIVAPGSETLRYFAPEVALALERSLGRSGIEMGSTGEHGIGVVVEALGETRVRLIGRARGRIAALEGPLEEIDVLTNQLAVRLGPLLLDDNREAARSKTSKPLLATRSPPGTVSSEPAPSPPPQAAPPTAPADEPPPVAERRPVFVQDRVVAHAILDGPNSWPGSGNVATQALYRLLSQRFRLSIVPAGIGISSPTVAGEEGARMQARAVVMGRYLVIDYVPAAFGVAVHVRFDVEVVVEGKMVLRRSAESAAETLPVAVAAAIESIGSELRAAIGDLRGG